MCSQQQQNQFKSHLVQALTQNSLLINSTKEMRQSKNQQQQQQSPQPNRQPQSSVAPVLSTQQMSRKRPHSQTYEGECNQQQTSQFSSLLSPSLANFQQQPNLHNSQNADSSLYYPSNSNLLSPTLLNNYIQ